MQIVVYTVLNSGGMCTVKMWIAMLVTTSYVIPAIFHASCFSKENRRGNICILSCPARSFQGERGASVYIYKHAILRRELCALPCNRVLPGLHVISGLCRNR